MKWVGVFCSSAPRHKIDLSTSGSGWSLAKAAMALGKQLCCFGIVLVMLWLEANAFSTHWSSRHTGVSSSSLSTKSNRVPGQRAPQVVPKQPVQPPAQRPAQQPAPQPKPKPPPKQTPVQMPKPETKDPTVDKCRVADADRVPCGVPGTSAGECQALDCCFDGSQCYYGQTGSLFVWLTWCWYFLI